MDLSILQKFGLSDGEVKVYSFLLDNGESPASKIIASTGLKKGDCYNKIYDLVEKGLAEEFEKNKVKYFRLLHPAYIEQQIDNIKEEVERNRKQLTSIMPEIISSFKLSHHQPGVKVFEGREGIERVVYDSLSSKTEIFSYIDIETVEKLISSSSKKYYRKRKELNLTKKNLIIDSPFSTEFAKKSQDEFTETRILDGVTAPFKTTMTIYDNKISYITLKEGAMIGVIVEDKFIANMHKILFEKAWESAAKLTQSMPQC